MASKVDRGETELMSDPASSGSQEENDAFANEDSSHNIKDGVMGQYDDGDVEQGGITTVVNENDVVTRCGKTRLLKRFTNELSCCTNVTLFLQ